MQPDKDELIKFIDDFFKKKVRLIDQYEKIKSGYPRGRPRKGEVRPPSIAGIMQERYRMLNPELSAERNRIAQQEWRVRVGRENANAMKRQSKLRMRHWSKMTLSTKVDLQVSKAKETANK